MIRRIPMLLLTVLAGLSFGLILVSFWRPVEFVWGSLDSPPLAYVGVHRYGLTVARVTWGASTSQQPERSGQFPGIWWVTCRPESLTVRSDGTLSYRSSSFPSPSIGITIAPALKKSGVPIEAGSVTLHYPDIMVAWVRIWPVSLPLLLIAFPIIAFVRGGLRRRRRRKQGRCLNCGYDLTGNTSGTCPECGTAVTGGAVSSQHSAVSERGVDADPTG